MLRKSPGFTATAVLTLALGIGSNTAVLSAVNGILLSPLPYADADRLVTIGGYKNFAGIAIRMDRFLPETWQQIQAQTPTIEQVARYRTEQSVLTGITVPKGVAAGRVTGDFFPLLGVRPLAGRDILPTDAQPGSQPVAVLTYSLWRGVFGGDPNVIGRKIMLNEEPCEIVGVMPRQSAAFLAPTRMDFGSHFQMMPKKNR